MPEQQLESTPLTFENLMKGLRISKERHENPPPDPPMLFSPKGYCEFHKNMVADGLAQHYRWDTCPMCGWKP